MAKPRFSFKLSNFRDDFRNCMQAIDGGQSVEIVKNYKQLAIMKPNTDNQTSEHTYNEQEASRHYQDMFVFVAQGKTVVITRGGKISALVIPGENAPQ